MVFLFEFRRWYFGETQLFLGNHLVVYDGRLGIVLAFRLRVYVQVNPGEYVHG